MENILKDNCGKLDSITLLDLKEARKWRNENFQSIRTNNLTTLENQEEYFKVLERKDHKYYAYRRKNDNALIGICGINNISYENKRAEISIIIAREFKKMGYGSKMIRLLLNYAFNYLNINTIYGECFHCNPAIKFWEKVIEKYEGYKTMIPATKYYNNYYYDSLFFSIDKNNFNWNILNKGT